MIIGTYRKAHVSRLHVIHPPNFLMPWDPLIPQVPSPNPSSRLRLLGQKQASCRCKRSSMARNATSHYLLPWWWVCSTCALRSSIFIPFTKTTPDGYVDLTPFLVVGQNTVVLKQTGDQQKYVFILQSHHPTRAQLKPVLALRKQNQQWVQWLKEVSKPLEMPPDSRFAIDSASWCTWMCCTLVSFLGVSL